MKMKIINGANLNMLGMRDTNIYGNKSYDELVSMIKTYCEENKIKTEFFVNNSEGEIINSIHDTYFKEFDGLIINPGAYTHYSYAIHDALAILKCLIVEVHISDINHRETYRKVNVISDVCDYSIIGEGLNGYIKAVQYLESALKNKR